MPQRLPTRSSSAPRAAAGLIAGWIAVNTVWGLVLGIQLARLNGAPWSQLPALGAFWSGLYLGATLPGLAAAAIWMLVTRRHGLCGVRGLALGASGAAITLLFVNFLFRWGPAYQTVALVSPMILPMGALDITALVSSCGLAMLGAERLATRLAGGDPSGSRPFAPWLLAALCVLAAVHAANAVYERPSRVDLSLAVAPFVEPDPSCRPTPGPASGLVVLAVDGMTWNVAAPLLAEGRMPNLKRLLARSAYAPLDSLHPSFSPVVWASVATGLRQEAHRVDGFLRTWLPGVDVPISRGPLLNAFFWWGGANRLLAWVARTPLARSEALPSTQRRGLALWDVAGANGYSVGIFDWMNTWPASRVPGYMYTSHGGATRNAYPEAEVLSVIESLPAPGTQPEHRRLGENARSFEQAFALFEAFRPDVSFHFNKLIDVSHDFWAAEPHWWVRPVELPERRFEPIVDEAYEITDHWIGRFLDATPPGHVLAVVSDHGYEFNGTGHLFAPPGVVILSGGPFACARILSGPVSVLDVAPTLLAVVDLPGLESMPGKVVSGAY